MKIGENKTQEGISLLQRGYCKLLQQIKYWCNILVFLSSYCNKSNIHIFMFIATIMSLCCKIAFFLVVGINGVGDAIGPEWEPLRVGKVKGMFWEEEEETGSWKWGRVWSWWMLYIIIVSAWYKGNYTYLISLYFFSYTFFSMKREEVLGWSKCYGPIES